MQIWRTVFCIFLSKQNIILGNYEKFVRTTHGLNSVTKLCTTGNALVNWNPGHRTRYTEGQLLCFSYDFPMMVLASAYLRSIHPPDNEHDVSILIMNHGVAAVTRVDLLCSLFCALAPGTGREINILTMLNNKFFVWLHGDKIYNTFCLWKHHVNLLMQSFLNP
jgi:hypothetical protein